MLSKKPRIHFFVFVCLASLACNALGIFATPTPILPTPTKTSTPTRTPSPTMTATPTMTETPTIIPTPTLSPTPMLDAEGVERMMLCYEAAVLVYADTQAYYKITGLAGKTLDEMLSGYYDYEKVAPRVRNFRSERRSRSVRIAALMSDEVLIRNNALISGLSSQDCLDGKVKWAIRMTNLELDSGRISGVGAFSTIQSLRKNVSGDVKRLRTDLENVYGVDPATLDVIADPIWQNVQNRYGVTGP